VPARPDPVADDALDALFGDLAGPPRLGLAVSGGPDSTALLVLLDRWSRRRGGPDLIVLTVDHGLRPESPDDARFVADLAARLGRPCVVLGWDHGSGQPGGDVQAAARRARYGLLAAAAAEHGCAIVALGHTLDDKAETLLIRLGRGSGLAGLAAMPAERTVDGIRFVRPLIALPKARLEATLTAAGIGWRSDPSNMDADRFLRAKVRALMPALAEIGLTADRLAATADRLALASDAINPLVRAVAAEALVDHGGAVSLDRAALAAAGPEVAYRLLADACRRVRPGDYPPRAAALVAVVAALADGAARRRTGGGLVFDPRGDRLWVYAEAGRAGFPEVVVDRAGTFVWDGRFTVVVTGTPDQPHLVRAARAGERRRDLPPRVAGSLPVVVGADGSGREAVELRPPGGHPEDQSTTSADRGDSDTCSGWQSPARNLHSDHVRSCEGVPPGVVPGLPRRAARTSKV
jgi:tRNA(Ile)-lysidine synthase